MLFRSNNVIYHSVVLTGIMTIIRFQQANIFNKIGEYDLCLFYGHHGMAFGLGYNLLKKQYPILSEIDMPFERSYIELEKNKFLVCIPKRYLSDNEMKESIFYWLNFAKENNLKSIVLTGARDSSKINISDIPSALENDNKRVKFIAKILREWLSSNRSVLTEVLLIAKSDNYSRNFYKGPYVM